MSALLHVCVRVRACGRVRVFACPPMRNSPGTPLASRDEEVLEVKAGDLVLQRRLLLHSGGGGGGGDASGSGPSLAHTPAKTQSGACGAGLGGEARLEAGRMVMGRESAVKSNGMPSLAVLCDNQFNFISNLVQHYSISIFFSLLLII